MYVNRPKLVCGNNKKSPISSTKLHKIKTAEPILSDVSADILGKSW